MKTYPFGTLGQRDTLLRRAKAAVKACDEAIAEGRLHDAAEAADEVVVSYAGLGRGRHEQDWLVRAATLRAVLAGQVAASRRAA